MHQDLEIIRDVCPKAIAGPWPERLVPRADPHDVLALPCRESAPVPAGLIAAALDHIPSGVAVVDAAGTILAANRAAHRIVGAGDGLSEREGHLRTGGADGDLRLGRAVAEAAGAGRLPRSGGCVRIARPSGKPAYMVTVTPLADAAAPPARLGPGCALILIGDPDRDRLADLAPALQAAFGLTRAEARAAALIGQGLAPRHAALRLGISVATIRSELKSVYAKLRISRQGELVTAIARLAPLIPEGAPSVAEGAAGPLAAEACAAPAGSRRPGSPVTGAKQSVQSS